MGFLTITNSIRNEYKKIRIQNRISFVYENGLSLYTKPKSFCIRNFFCS